jgi:isoleucyl-tRNA synthetase
MRTVAVEANAASSTAVRAALADGDLAHAAQLLGRPFTMSGRVTHGDKLGRHLGFPTANIPLKRQPPLSGIFAVRVHGLALAPRTGVASLGVRPTVKADARPLLEVFIFDFDDAIYGRRLAVEFLHKLRDEERYADLRRSHVRSAPTPSRHAPISPTKTHARRHPKRLQVHAEFAGHAVSDARRSRETRAGVGARWQQNGVYEAIRAASKVVRVSCCTTAAVREWRHPYRDGVQQNPQGHRRQEQDDGGFDAPYVPGWDCHGMPIEVQIEKTYGKNLSTRRRSAVPRVCDRADRAPTTQFQRLGVLGDWDHPYTTMEFKSEADEIRTLGKLLERGYLYRGLKPSTGVSIATARWPRRRSNTKIASTAQSTSDFRSSILAERAKLARAFALDGAARGRGYAVIWTTTPWTIPANQALNVHPQFTYALVRTARGYLVVAEDWSMRASSRYGDDGQVVATAKARPRRHRVRASVL